MVQPKTPPLSVRLGEERLARIDAFAAKNKLSRHLTILALIDAGLVSLSAEWVRLDQGTTPGGAPFDAKAVYDDVKSRFPKIMAKLAEGPPAKPAAFTPHPKPGKR